MQSSNHAEVAAATRSLSGSAHGKAGKCRRKGMHACIHRQMRQVHIYKIGAGFTLYLTVELQDVADMTAVAPRPSSDPILITIHIHTSMCKLNSRYMSISGSGLSHAFGTREWVCGLTSKVGSLSCRSKGGGGAPVRGACVCAHPVSVSDRRCWPVQVVPGVFLTRAEPRSRRSPVQPRLRPLSRMFR
jgi:hypothetical protein